MILQQDALLQQEKYNITTKRFVAIKKILYENIKDWILDHVDIGSAKLQPKLLVNLKVGPGPCVSLQKKKKKINYHRETYSLSNENMRIEK